MKLIILFSLFVTPALSSESNNDDCAAIVAKMKRNPLYEDFTEEMLQGFCDKKKQWEARRDDANHGVHGANKDEENSSSESEEDEENEIKHKPHPQKKLTSEQSTFLKDIWRCRGSDCFGSMWRKYFTYLRNYTWSESRKRGFLRSGTSSSIQLVRKEYRAMTDAERERFHEAVIQLKMEKIDGKPKYDLIVDYHLASLAPEAHFTCAFLLYHRELLKQFEIALRLLAPDVSVPYWDSTLDYGLPNPCESIIFSPLFLGNPDGEVTEGFCANWKPTRSVKGSSNNLLYRQCGKSKNGRLLKQSDIDKVNKLANAKDILCSCDKNYTYLELAHGTVHNFVGGHLYNVEVSPNDPAFFLHHCFIDYIWEQWRLKNQNRNDRETDYPNDDKGCVSDSTDDALAPMLPFQSVNVIFGLSNSYTDNLYTYALRPSCPSNCPGPYLFCAKSNKCTSKIRSGGNCTGLAGYDCCYDGKCVEGVCQ